MQKKAVEHGDYLNHSQGKRKAARELLLLCTTANLSSQVEERLGKVIYGPVDWEYLVRLADYQGVLPLVTHHLSTNGFSSCIPEPYLDRFRRAYKYTVYRNVVISNELSKVVNALRSEGIDTVCLKGTAMAEVIYGNACLRPVTDMDVLIRSRDWVKADGTIAGLGYKPVAVHKNGKHPFHEEYFREAAFTLFLELHWNLENKQLVAFPEEQLWSRTQPMEQNGIASRMLSPEDNLLFLANHLFKHNKQRLKFLCDIAELLKKYQGILDWNYITCSALSWQINPALYLALKRAEELLGAPVPAGACQSLRPNIWRCSLLEFLAGRESFSSQNKETKLNSETANLAHSLMMKGLHETKAVLKRYRNPKKSVKWLRTAFWTTMVMVSGLGRYLTRLLVRTA